MSGNSQIHDEPIQAAGGLLWRQGANGPEIALVFRKRYRDWTLPKGKLEPGEPWMEAALREVQEETGCEAKIVGFAGAVAYQTGNGPKVVRFWNMRLERQGNLADNPEVKEVAWFSREAALKRLQYPVERALVEAWKSPEEASE